MKIDFGIWSYVTFGCYLLMMVGVGAYFCKKNSSIQEYLLGGRGLGSWVTAFSAQASDMSGWLLMGLPGAIYFSGCGEVWVAIGLLVGTFFNWIIVAKRLRIYTEKHDSLTLSSFFADRFRDPSNMLRMVSAIVILLFFTIYAASCLVAAGKLFETMFGMPYKYAVLLGTVVVLLYTVMGGYLAVCWTDLIQGGLMFIALIVVPILAVCNGALNNYEMAVEAAAAARKLQLSLVPDLSFAGIMAIISAAAWGLGYFGQPHILSRFMSIKDTKLLPRTITIAMIWVTFSLLAAVCVGLISISMFKDLSASSSENVFIYMVGQLCPAWVAGIFLAAILAAIMSTIDSQLLVSSSTLTSDFYARVLRKEATPAELLKVSRVSVIIITVIACLLALSPFETIFNIVKVAWSGFGAAFGPVVLMALYSRKTSWQSALCGMIAGTVVSIGWYCCGLRTHMYEIVPGMIANFVAIILLNRVFGQPDREILKEFDEVVAEAKGE